MSPFWPLFLLFLSSSYTSILLGPWGLLHGTYYRRYDYHSQLFLPLAVRIQLSIFHRIISYPEIMCEIAGCYLTLWGGGGGEIVARVQPTPPPCPLQ